MPVKEPQDTLHGLLCRLSNKERPYSECELVQSSVTIIIDCSRCGVSSHRSSANCYHNAEGPNTYPWTIPNLIANDNHSEYPEEVLAASVQLVHSPLSSSNPRTIVMMKIRAPTSIITRICKFKTIRKSSLVAALSLKFSPVLLYKWI